MRFLSRLFDSTTTTVTETHTLDVAPDMPGRITFRPDVLAVEYRNGRFRQLRVSGSAVAYPGVRVTRQFDKLRDVPEWARGYVSEVR